MSEKIHKSHDSLDTNKESFRIAIWQNAIWVCLAILIIFGDFAKDWVQNRYKYQEFTLHTLNLDAIRDSIIIEHLYLTLNKTGADRARIFRFHNGGMLAGGVPFKKMSCTHEVVSPGVSQEISSLKDIPLSSIPEFTKLITENDSVFDVNVQNVLMSAFRAALESQNIKYLVVHRIMLRNEVWGFVSVDYNKTTDISNLTNELNRICFDGLAHLVELEIIKAVNDI